jgi:hypothetical protein
LGSLCVNVLTLAKAGKSIDPVWLSEKTGYPLKQDQTLAVRENATNSTEISAPAGVDGLTEKDAQSNQT